MIDPVSRNDIPTSKLGSVGKLADGRKFVHFERHLAHAIDRVWTAITDPEHLRDWFPGIQFERRVGGHLQIWFSEECNGPADVTGNVVRYEPPHVLELGSMRFELVEDGDGCILRFTDILNFDWDLTEVEVMNSVLGGWHKYLDTLEFALGGDRADPRKMAEPDYARFDIEGRA